MFTLSQSKQATTTTKQPIKKQNRRKALPLPILSLQTKSELNPETCPKQKAKPTKPPIRENFKKMLDILNKPDSKNQCLPNNYYNKINHSKDLLRKRMRTNLDCGPSKLDNLLLRTEIFNAMKMMEGSDKPKSEEDAESSSLRASTNNLQRTIRFRKKSKPSLQTHSNRFMKWESFCTSISYQNKNPQCLPNLNLSKKLSHRTYIIKKRSESTLTHKNVVEDINGWEDAPVRYATDYDRLDFSEVYD